MIDIPTLILHISATVVALLAMVGGMVYMMGRQ